MANARRLMEMGLAGPTATELAAQIEAQSGDGERLVRSAIMPMLSFELAAQIDAAGTTNAPKLVEMSMPPELAVEVVAQIESDRV